MVQKRRHTGAQHPAIVGQIVAADQRQRTQARRSPRDHRLRQIMIDAVPVRDDARQIGGAVRPPPITLFGDGQRHDPRVGRGEAFGQPLGRSGGDDHLADRADQADGFALARPFGDGVEAVLRRHLVMHAARAQRGGRNRPIAVARRHRVVGIDRLMRAVERAQADMDDADPLRRPVIAEASDALGQRRGGRFAEASHSRYAVRTSPLVRA